MKTISKTKEEWIDLIDNNLILDEDIEQIVENQRIVNAFKAWFVDIEKSDVDEFAPWYIIDRMKMILENESQ